jgi:hypothetical protein
MWVSGSAVFTITKIRKVTALTPDPAAAPAPSAEPDADGEAAPDTAPAAAAAA